MRSRAPCVDCWINVAVDARDPDRPDDAPHQISVMMVADIVGSSRILARKVHIRRHLVEGSCTSDVGPWRGQVSGTRDVSNFLTT